METKLLGNSMGNGVGAIFFIFILHVYFFQLPDKPWSQVGVVPSAPPVLAFNFYRA